MVACFAKTGVTTLRAGVTDVTSAMPVDAIHGSLVTRSAPMDDSISLFLETHGSIE